MCMFSTVVWVVEHEIQTLFIPVTIDKRAINRQLPQGQMRAAKVSAATQMETEMTNIYLLLRGNDKEMNLKQVFAGWKRACVNHTTEVYAAINNMRLDRAMTPSTLYPSPYRWSYSRLLIFHSRCWEI